MKTTFLLLSFFLPFFVKSQSQQGIKSGIEKFKGSIRYKAVDSFYRLNNYSFYWTLDTAKAGKLIEVLRSSEEYGLNEKDYQYRFVQSYLADQSLKNTNDSIEAEIRFTDAAIHFFTEIKIGNQSPSLSYDGLKYVPDASNMVSLLKEYSDKEGLNGLIQILQPRSREFVAIYKLLVRFLHVIHDSNYKQVKVVSNKINYANKPLLLKLYQLGAIDSINHSITDKDLRQKLKKRLQLFDVLNDGVLRSTGMEALNIPLERRVLELKYALNYLRWLEQIRQTSTILILNIPSANFLVYDKGQLILDSKAIVGKRSTPTPTLSSTITEVILYPYWTVPKKIATRELLPSIKRSVEFLNLGNFQIINKQGKVLNPYSINWKALSTSYFPYIIRQSTGCDNALGIVKFNFYNPFSVYLHDTPGKGLFYLNKRYFSHGCMRVEKPEELAHLVLVNNRVAIDTLTAKGCVNHQSPIVVAVEKKLPILILYSTVWYNKEGEIKFYDDIYGRLN